MSGLTWDGVMDRIYYLIAVLLQIAGFLAVAAVIVYGLKFVMAKEDPAKRTAAKKGLGYSIVGMLIIFGVYTILATVRGAVGALGN